MNKSKFDLEDLLLEFSVLIIRVTESMKRSRAANAIADQLLRSGTSPYGNHGEAEGAESRWLRLVQRAQLIAKPTLLESLIIEADELVRIFASSIRTAQRNGGSAT